jgi:hypothetical protein
VCTLIVSCKKVIPMNKRLITCSVCGFDQRIYGGKVCNHDGIGAIRCTGSRMPVQEVWEQALKAIDATKAKLDYDDQIQLMAAERYYNDD